jgi:hypothetical protein
VMHKTEYDPDTHKRIDTVVGIKEGYYPAAVEPDVFERVNARLDTKAPRGRNAVRPVTSIVAGVAKCADCGDSMIRVSKGDYVYLVCARAHMRAGCKYQAVQYQEVEDALRENAKALVEDAPRGEETATIEREIVNRDLQLSEMKDEAKELLRELRLTGSPTVRSALREAEQAIKVAEAKLRELKDRRERLGMPFVVRRLNTLQEELLRRKFDVAAANHALRAAVDRIVVAPERGLLDVHWRDSDAVSEVPFWSRHMTVFSDAAE